MNAKEFAHELEKAASFIRQQQAEIKALKQIIDANNLNQNIGQFVKPTNEPVAVQDVRFDLHPSCAYPAIYTKHGWKNPKTGDVKWETVTIEP